MLNFSTFLYFPQGKYKIKAEFADPRDESEIGCFELIVEVQEKPQPEEEDDYDDSCFFFC